MTPNTTNVDSNITKQQNNKKLKTHFRRGAFWHRFESRLNLIKVFHCSGDAWFKFLFEIY